MSSKPSLSGENGLGDNERPAADGIPFVNMLLVCKGVAPDGATDVLQLRLSLLSIDGLMRSMDLPAVGADLGAGQEGRAPHQVVAAALAIIT